MLGNDECLIKTLYSCLGSKSYCKRMLVFVDFWCLMVFFHKTYMVLKIRVGVASLGNMYLCVLCSV